MARTNIIGCDWCRETMEIEDDETTVEQGWLEVARYDTLKEDIVHLDFCSEECLVSHFQ
jgi:hypothetical protein